MSIHVIVVDMLMQVILCKTTNTKILGLSAGTGAHCGSFVCETMCFGSILELNIVFCLVSFVLRHSFSGTHRRSQDAKERLRSPSHAT